MFATLLAFLAFMTHVFVANAEPGNWMLPMLALIMLLAAIYSIFSIAFRYRIALYIIQSICLVIITVQVSIANGTIDSNYLFLIITAAFKIFIIPFFLYRSLSFGMKLMPLHFYLRFVAAKKNTRSRLESDPLFMQSHMSTSRALFYAGILVALSFLISSVLGGTTLMLPIAASIILIGMLIIASKSHLILQLFGFLIMENGVVLLPSALHIRLPLIGETIALIDVVILVAIALLLSFKMRETHGTLDTKKFMELVEQR